MNTRGGNSEIHEEKMTESESDVKFLQTKRKIHNPMKNMFGRFVREEYLTCVALETSKS